MVPLQTHGCYNGARKKRLAYQAVVPLQTHGCYNDHPECMKVLYAVVPLQTHGCYNNAYVRNNADRSRGSPTDSRVL